MAEMLQKPYCRVPQTKDDPLVVGDIIGLVRKACEVVADEMPRCGSLQELESCLARHLDSLPRDAIPFDHDGNLVVHVDEMSALATPGVAFRRWPQQQNFAGFPSHCLDQGRKLVISVPEIIVRRSSPTALALAYNNLTNGVVAFVVAAFEPSFRSALLNRAFSVDEFGVIEIQLAGLPQSVGGMPICHWHLSAFKAWLAGQGLPRPPPLSELTKSQNAGLLAGALALRFTLPKDQRPHNFHLFSPDSARPRQKVTAVDAPHSYSWWGLLCRRLKSMRFDAM